MSCTQHINPLGHDRWEAWRPGLKLTMCVWLPLFPGRQAGRQAGMQQRLTGSRDSTSTGAAGGGVLPPLAEVGASALAAAAAASPLAWSSST